MVYEKKTREFITAVVLGQVMIQSLIWEKI
jgi:hypothetical protein